MKDNLKISVIMPVYNSSNSIVKTIESVMNQSYENYELIIVENGVKTDLQSLINNNKIIYYYLNEPNVSKARNLGLKNATGNYITFIDSDDFYRQDFLEKMVNEIKKADIVTCGFFRTDLKEDYKVSNYQDLINTSNIQNYMEKIRNSILFNNIWNKIYCSNIIKDNNIYFDENYNLGEDLLFNLEYFKYVKKASYINESLYTYVRDNSSKGLDHGNNNSRFNLERKLVTKWLEFYNLKGWKTSFVYNLYGRVYYNEVLRLHKEKDYKEIEKIVNNNKEELEKIGKKADDKKFVFFINKVLLKGINKVKFFMKLNDIKRKFKKVEEK